MLVNQRYNTVIWSDSQCLITFIESLSPETYDIRNNVPCNDFANKPAKQAAKLPEPDAQPTPVSYSVARVETKRYIKDGAHVHQVASESCKGYFRKKVDSQINCGMPPF